MDLTDKSSKQIVGLNSLSQLILEQRYLYLKSKVYRDLGQSFLGFEVLFKGCLYDRNLTRVNYRQIYDPAVHQKCLGQLENHYRVTGQVMPLIFQTRLQQYRQSRARWNIDFLVPEDDILIFKKDQLLVNLYKIVYRRGDFLNLSFFSPSEVVRHSSYLSYKNLDQYLLSL